LSAGPALGGFLISSLGWRWVFWVNVPAGLLGAGLGLLVLPRTERNWKPGQFDLVGAGLLVPALTLLLFALNQAGRTGIGSPMFISLIAGGVILLFGFAYRELHAGSPLIDPGLFRNPVFVAGNIAGLLSYAVLFGAFFVLPFVLERIYGASSLMAGLRLTAIPVALGVVAPISGALYDRVGGKLLKAAGMLTVLASSLLLAYELDADTAARLSVLTVLFALLGAGQGLFTAPNNSAVMGRAAAEETGQAGGLLNTMRSFGMSFGISLATLILSSQLSEAAGGPLKELPAADIGHGAAMSFIAFAAMALVAAGLSLVRDNRSKRLAS
jgi:MFS family permease